MSVTYVAGRAGSGKTKWVYDEIRQAMEAHKPVFLVVPDQFVLQTERNLLYELNKSSIVGVEILSLSRLAEKVRKTVGPLTQTMLDKQGHSMLMRRVLADIEGLTYYSSSVKQESFCTMLADQFLELKRYGVGAVQLKEAALKTQGVLRQRLLELCLIYEKTEKYKFGEYVDAADRMAILAQDLKRSEILENAHVFIDGIDSFDARMGEIFETMLNVCERVVVTFCMDLTNGCRDQGLFRNEMLNYDALHTVATNGAHEERFVYLEQTGFDAPPALKHMERNLFALPYEVYEHDPTGITLLEADNPYTEVEKLCCDILDAAQTMRFGDMAVLCDVESYQQVLSAAFERYDIPFFLDARRSVDNQPVMTLIVASLYACARGYQKRDVMALVKSGFSALSQDEAELFEIYVIERGIDGPRFMYRIKTPGHEKLEEVRKKVIGPLNALQTQLEQAADLKGMLRALYQYLAGIKLKERLDTLVSRLYESGELDLAEQYAQMWNKGINDLLDQAFEILGGEKIQPLELARLIESGFASMEFGLLPTGSDEVIIVDADRSRLDQVKALFVVGCNDGLIPHGGSDGLLNEQDLSELESVGLKAGQTALYKQSAQNHKLYRMFSKTSLLSVSYALSDVQGRALRPSLLISAIRKIFPKLKAQTGVQPETLIRSKKSTFAHLIRALREQGKESFLHPLWQSVYQRYASDAQYRERLLLVEDALRGGNTCPPVPQEMADRLFGKGRLSVSRVESYMACPYRHFVQYGLRPVQHREYAVEKIDLGVIYHDMVKEYVYAYGDDKSDADMELCMQRTQKVLDPILQQHNDGILFSSARYRNLARRIRRIGARSVWAISKQLQHSGFVPLYQEIVFGEGGIPPILIELADGTVVRMSGRIDRVDICETDRQRFLTVIDYKSGQSGFDYGDYYAGLKLQLGVYMKALLSHAQSGVSGAQPAGMFYFRVQDPVVQTNSDIQQEVEALLQKEFGLDGVFLKDVRVVRNLSAQEDGAQGAVHIVRNKDGSIRSNDRMLDPHELEAMLAYAEALCRQAVERIRNGDISILPVRKKNFTACSICDYRAVCGFDRRRKNTYRQVAPLTAKEFFERLNALPQSMKEER
ncbi:MAG: PD-(D/E)XK nuclease family protein [Christensenellales bacterium]